MPQRLKAYTVRCDRDARIRSTGAQRLINRGVVYAVTQVAVVLQKQKVANAPQVFRRMRVIFAYYLFRAP
jgi:hypothetical protein